MQEELESKLKVAEYLLKIKAIQINVDSPYTWASGLKSPIYCDNRVILSYPIIRNYIRQEMVKSILNQFAKPDIIAGVATGGIPMGVLVAQEMGIPFIYVRSEAKNHGMQNQVEGVLEEGQSVMVVEDLISTGNSSLKAIKALQKQKAKVKGLISVFSYGFNSSKNLFEKEEIKVYSMTNFDILLQEAERAGSIKNEHFDTLLQWRKSPENWTNN